MQASNCAQSPRADRVARARTTRVAELVAAWMLLLVVDVVGKMFGFGPLCRAVSRRQTSRWRSHEPAFSTRTLCKAVDAACAYYFHRVDCLQSAAATVCLLRLHGIPADLVIGVQRLPFEAHAWVESDGQIVMNDRSRLAPYQAIARF
jgi:hypothetical protein